MLGFDDLEWNRLGSIRERTTEEVIRASTWSSLPFSINDVNLRWSDFEPDICTLPAALVDQNRVD